MNFYGRSKKAAEARLAEDQGTEGEGVCWGAGGDRPEPAAYDLHLGAVPEQGRLLGAGHGDVHDPGQHLHPVVQVLFRSDRAPDAA